MNSLDTFWDSIGPYDITLARMRTEHFSDNAMRYLWMYNEKLKKEIAQCSLSGMTEASVDIWPKGCTTEENRKIADNLVTIYASVGYKTDYHVLHGYDIPDCFRVIVNWEERK